MKTLSLLKASSLFLSILLLLCACGKEESETPAIPEEPETPVVSEDPNDDGSDASLESSEYVSQADFDNLVVGHLWACYDKFWGDESLPYNSDGEAIDNSLYCGDWDFFRGFKIEGGKLYEYLCACAPGLRIDPIYQVFRADKYTYNPMTGELEYDVPNFSGRIEHRRIVLKELNEDGLFIRYRFGCFFIDTPTFENPDKEDLSNEIDEGSHFRMKLRLFSGEKEAEYLSDFVLMN